jgi:hypothetical protein
MVTKRKPKLSDVVDARPAGEVAAARAQDAMVAAIVRRARRRPTVSEADPESARQSVEFMTKMRLGSQRALARRIQNKELVSKDELIAMLGGRRRWVNDAIRAGRLFSLIAPSGLEYFPVFFADYSYEPRALAKVVKVLEGLPSESKYFFFTSKSLRLNMTPLEALVQGMTLEVVNCAVGFAHS